MEKIPSKFKARIKNLLELDWRINPSSETGTFAFTKDGPAGTGTDVMYTANDAFCLAIAMDLVDASLKPSDVVFLLRHVRQLLLDEYNWIIEHKGSLEQRLLPRDAKGWPTYRDNGSEWADCHSFVVISRLVFKEAFPLLKGVSRKVPIYLEPIFCRGVEGLAREMKNAGYHYRKAMVVELTGTTEFISEILPKAPRLKKGWQ